MEKFAVDLDKVLNDFEYSEEQLKEYSTDQRSVNNPFNHDYKIYSSRFRTPAADYQQSRFEPVNLADADFSVTARPQVQSNYVVSPYPDTSENMPVLKNSVCDENVEDSMNNDRLNLTQIKDFKPDLIETNADLGSNLNEFCHIERHLPDIASANIEAKEEKVNFDLISDSFNREPVPAADINVEETPPKIIRFPVTSEISDSELHQYLEELEENEFASELPDQIDNRFSAKTLDSITVNENGSQANKILIKVEPDKQLYLEKSEVKVNEVESSVMSLRTERSESESTMDEKTTLCLNTSTGDVKTVETDDFKHDGIVSTPEDVEADSSFMNLTDSVDTSNDDSDNTETKILTGESSMNFDSKPLEVIAGENIVCFNEHRTNVLPVVDDSVSESVEYTSSPISEITCDSSQDGADEGAAKDENDGILTGEDEQEEGNESTVQADAVIDKVSNKDILDRPECKKSMEADVITSIQAMNDNQIPSSESNYQILDSKTAISTFEQCSDDNAKASSSLEESVGASENADKPKLQRPDSLDLTHTSQNSEMSSTSADSGSLLSHEERKLGKEQPFWIPDNETSTCMQCQFKFTLVKRRHHCRACGLVLCSKCCDVKAKLEYLGFEEARVCHSCYNILKRIDNFEAEISSMGRPNPNNPMEYCSTIPPPLQVGPTQPTPPSVLVPVLKREGRPKSNDPPKQVIFSDGIRPGSEMSDRDLSTESRISSIRRHTRVTKRASTPPGNMSLHRRMLNPETRSFIPSSNDLPPAVAKTTGEYIFFEIEKPLTVDDAPVRFAINRNLFVTVKRILLDCCVNRDVWSMTTEGLSCVGQDEIVFVLEVLPEEKHPPKDVFSTVNMLYQEAAKGSTVTEMSYASLCLGELFGSKEHGGFVFIRPTYQCIQKLLLPKAPYLIALLIHRWETQWARLFPIRLVLRLGAEYRYYPCPLVSVRNRPALFTDIGHTIISLLADFRKYSYSLPSVRGLVIHMEDRLTTISLPRNRYDQVIRAMNNSEENVLAFAGNISTQADSHLVSIQSTQDDTSYTTQAINIHNKPRQVTGASFVVFNGSLKQCAWAGKSNIVEDGLMVQIPSESMSNLRSALKQMKDYSIGCGPQAEEVVVLKWTPDDVNFNIGVRSNIDDKPLDGVPSIRVHNGIDYSATLRLIRWTEVFILQSDEVSDNKTGDTVNISKLSESIARATCVALVPLLDLLATADLTTIAIRATIHPENVGYEAGSRGEKLPPIYMKSLDETLIAVVHEAAVAIRDMSSPTVLELIFKVMEHD